LAGFALTGVQSVNRAMTGLLSPKSRSAEFYGFFSVAGRTSSFIGPTIYGLIAAEVAILFRSQGVLVNQAEQMGQKYAMLSVIAFLTIGLIILLSVNVKKGQEAARKYDYD